MSAAPTSIATVPASIVATGTPDRLLLGPGPSPVAPSVYEAQALPVTGHLDPWFVDRMDEVADMLRTVFRTTNRVTYAASSTGSGGMQTLLSNVVEPGDRVVVGVNGVFGGRIVDAVGRLGGVPVPIEAPWGQVIDPQRVADALAAHPDTALVALVHAETSTGAHQPIAPVGEIVADHRALLMVDTVTGLAGVDVDIDEWGVDMAFSGTQKCLSVPPGLSPVTFSDAALERIGDRTSAVGSWYFDVSAIAAYWGAERRYHHTAPISALLGLHEGLRLVMEEGLATRITRHARVGARLQSELVARGFELLAAEGHRLPQLTACALPAGLEEAPLRSRLLDDHGIEVGGGLGAFAGRAWRIGLMGEGAHDSSVDRVLAAIDDVID